ncbi:UNVERIFIED_CONTAM: hypothetical protein GTU68_020153 [Idotea baltica]|nr:hypothetical protein [Idotea baltica]
MTSLLPPYQCRHSLPPINDVTLPPPINDVTPPPRNKSNPPFPLPPPPIDGRVFGQPANTVPLRLYIPILDVNDNPPRFQRTPYHFRVSEGVSPGATLFSDVTVYDADAGTNSQITLTCVQEEVRFFFFVDVVAVVVVVVVIVVVVSSWQGLVVVFRVTSFDETICIV